MCVCVRCLLTPGLAWKHPPSNCITSLASCSAPFCPPALNWIQEFFSSPPPSVFLAVVSSPLLSLTTSESCICKLEELLPVCLWLIKQPFHPSPHTCRPTVALSRCQRGSAAITGSDVQNESSMARGTRTPSLRLTEEAECG